MRNLKSSLQKSNFNFVTKLKWILIGLLALVLVGTLVFSFAGFNYSFDLVGGQMMTVEVKDSALISEEDYKKEYTDKISSLKKEIYSIFDDHGINIARYQLQGDGNDVKMVFSYKNKRALDNEGMAFVNAQIKNEIETSLNTTSTVVSFVASNGEAVSPAVNKASYVRLALAFVLVLVLSFAYIAIRFNVFAAISSLFTTLISSLSYLAVIAITRISFGSATIAGMGAMIVVILLGCVLFFNNVKEHYQEGTERLNHYEVANKATLKMLFFWIVAALVTMLSSAELAIFGYAFANGAVGAIGLNVMVGLMIGFASIVFVNSAIYGLITNKKNYNPVFNKLNK